MLELPDETVKIIRYLQSKSINPILYGSQGVSLYLGAFKDFGDVDLLIDGEWIDNRWPELIEYMLNFDYELIDEHEHEFRNAIGKVVAFADKNILIRDGIAESVEGSLSEFMIDGAAIETLSAETFKVAYEYSKKDGYRKNVRQKNDQLIIDMLDEYVRQAK